MRVLETGRPVAQRLVDGILERPPADLDRNDAGAHQLHPKDVELLPFDVLRAHVNDRLEAEQSAGDSGRDAVLAGAGFRDEPSLPHALREQRLGQHLVGLVRTAVEQILALEEDVAGQVAAASERRRATGIIRQQIIELRRESRVGLRIEERRFELLERRQEDFRNVTAAIPSKPSVQAHWRSSCRDRGRSASNKARIFSGDFIPRRASTAEPTSMA